MSRHWNVQTPERPTVDAVTYHPPRQLGLTIGAVGLALLVGLAVVFLLLLPQPPLGIVNFLWGFLFVLSLPAIGLLGYRSYGVLRSAYHIGPDALTIEWGAQREVIPLRDVKEVLAGKEIETALRPQGLWWPGCIAGRLATDRLGEIRFFATLPQEAQLFIVTESESFALSPESLDEFLNALEARRGLEATGEVQRESIRPAFLSWEIWRDPWARGLTAASAAVVAALFAYVLLILPTLPATMPLHFAADGSATPDRIGASRGLLWLPFIGLLTLAVNGVMGGVLHLREGGRGAAYLLWGTSAFAQILVWIAALGLIARA